MVVADRQVLARFEQEVAAPQAHHDRAAQARRPDDLAAVEDLPQVVEERVAAVLGRLDHLDVLVGTERQAVGALDPRLAQPLDRPRDRARVAVGARPERLRLERRGLDHAVDPGFRPAVEDGAVLGDRDLVGGEVERLEVDVDRAAIVVAHLRPRDGEVDPHLDQRPEAALQCVDALLADLDRVDPPEVRRRVLPTLRPDEVDQPPCRQRPGEPLARLVVEQLPVRIGQRRVAAQQVVHRPTPFMLPIPSEPSPPAIGATSSSPSSSSSDAASAASPWPTMSPSWNKTPAAISRQRGTLRRRNSRSIEKCLNSSPWASCMIARASASGSIESRCWDQPIAWHSSSSEAQSRANVRVSAESSSGGSWYWSNPIVAPWLVRGGAGQVPAPASIFSRLTGSFPAAGRPVPTVGRTVRRSCGSRRSRALRPWRRTSRSAVRTRPRRRLY